MLPPCAAWRRSRWLVPWAAYRVLQVLAELSQLRPALVEASGLRLAQLAAARAARAAAWLPHRALAARAKVCRLQLAAALAFPFSHALVRAQPPASRPVSRVPPLRRAPGWAQRAYPAR